MLILCPCFRSIKPVVQITHNELPICNAYHCILYEYANVTISLDRNTTKAIQNYMTVLWVLSPGYFEVGGFPPFYPEGEKGRSF